MDEKNFAPFVSVHWAMDLTKQQGNDWRVDREEAGEEVTKGNKKTFGDDGHLFF